MVTIEQVMAEHHRSVGESIGKRYALVVHLREVEGLTFAVIGQRLGFGRSRAHALYRAAKEREREIYQETVHGDNPGQGN